MKRISTFLVAVFLISAYFAFSNPTQARSDTVCVNELTVDGRPALSFNFMGPRGDGYKAVIMDNGDFLVGSFRTGDIFRTDTIRHLNGSGDAVATTYNGNGTFTTASPDGDVVVRVDRIEVLTPGGMDIIDISDDPAYWEYLRSWLRDRDRDEDDQSWADCTMN